MSAFRAAPRQGHLDRAKRIMGYLVKMKHGFIRVRTGEPDFSDLPKQRYDWSHTVYGDVREELPTDAPEPLGKEVEIHCFVDASHAADKVTRRSQTGILIFINRSPVVFFSKRQNFLLLFILLGEV